MPGPVTFEAVENRRATDRLDVISISWVVRILRLAPRRAPEGVQEESVCMVTEEIKKSIERGRTEREEGSAATGEKK